MADMRIDMVTVVVDDYDPAIAFFTGALGFELAEDVDAAVARMTSAGVTFVRGPRTQPYGKVAVFLDIAGNRWDLLGPA